jgi:hypothetical protein
MPLREGCSRIGTADRRARSGSCSPPALSTRKSPSRRQALPKRQRPRRNVEEESQNRKRGDRALSFLFPPSDALSLVP